MPRSFYRQLLIEIAMKQASDSKAKAPAEGKTREQILAEREAKKLAKQAKRKEDKPKPEAIKPEEKPKKVEKAPVKCEEKPKINEAKTAETGEKSKAQLKAERRALQEAQRAKKQEAVKVPKIEQKEVIIVAKKPSPKPKQTVRIEPTHGIKLFADLSAQTDYQSRVLCGVKDVHPFIARLGAQYRNRVICGSNVRCLALLNALKQVILDYRTLPSEELTRGIGKELNRSFEFLHQCRPVSVSMLNATKQLRAHLTRCRGSEQDIKEELVDWIDTYVKDQVEKAAEAISISVRQKISDGDVILTYGCSSLIQKILIAAAKEEIRFRVIVVDGRPWLEGRELLRRLLRARIPCTYILVNAVSFVMPQVTKILLGAHALLANGYVMSRSGSSQVALLGRTMNVPVLVCCETHKFSERVQTDSFDHNELGDPNEMIPKADITKWREIPSLTALNLVYDVTPPDLVSAVVTELAILPCTSVPVILRIK